MPRTGELLTTTYKNVLNIGDSEDEEDVVRERLLYHLRRAVNAMWWYRAWPWRVSLEGSLFALLGESSMIVPADFYAVGPLTRLWKVDDTCEIVYQKARVVRSRLRESPTISSRRPLIWSLLGQRSTQLAKPSAPTITPINVGGATTRTYKIVAKLFDERHSLPSTSGSSAFCNALLSTTNPVRITWTEVSGAYAYDVYWIEGNYQVGETITDVTLDHTSATQGTAGVALPTDDTTKGYSQLVVFADKASADTEFEMTDYVSSPPVLIDEVASGVEADGESLKRVPEALHESVFGEYLAKRIMRDEGDDREPLQDADFRKALADAWAAANPDQLDDDFLAPRYGEGSDD